MQMHLLKKRRERRRAAIRRRYLNMLTDPDVSDTDKYQAVINLGFKADHDPELDLAVAKLIREVDPDTEMILQLNPHAFNTVSV